MESEVTAVFIKTEKNVTFHELVYSEEENALSFSQNKEDSTLRQEPEIIFVPIKKEEENDDKLVCSNVNYYLEEAVCQKLTENLTGYEKDPLDICNSKVKHIKQEVTITEDVEKEKMQSIIDKGKYLTHENTKCSCEIVELEDECSAVTDIPSYTSVNEVHIHPSISYNSDRALASGDIESEASLLEDKQHENQHEFDNGVINISQNVSGNYEHFLCNKKFSSSSKLECHVNAVHNKIKNYNCNQCFKMFSKAYNLKKHIDEVHKGFKNYECIKCKKRFSEERYLEAHIDHVHRGIKSYECDECRNRFSQKGSLKTHIHLMHKGIEIQDEYKLCNQCQKLFSSIQTLERHMNAVHKRIKNYKCKECCKVFPYSHTLKRHIDSVHKRIKNYECNQCRKRFYYIGHCKRHIDHVHKLIKNDECNQ